MILRILKYRIANAFQILRAEGVLALFIAIYNYFWKTPIGAFLYWIPKGRLLLPDDSMWVLKSIGSGKDWYFPQSRDHYRFKPNRFDTLKDIYFETDQVSVNSDDIVFDIGAYIGVSSIVASRLGQKVIAIEASPIAVNCLQKNVAQYDNIIVVHCAVWDERGEIELQHGKSPSDDSVITPDDGGVNESSIVRAETVESIIAEYDIQRLDFLKIEAEGCEPEVCRGIDNCDVSKISAACGKERYGEDVQGEVAEILNQKEYNTFTELNHPDKMVYARNTESDQRK